MKALIFGANGQDGYYLQKVLASHNVDVIATSRSSTPPLNVSHFQSVEDAIKYHKPSYIFHLAAASTRNHRALFENHETIATGTLNILEVVKRHSPDTKVFICGSGLQFFNDGSPIHEHTPFEARDAYSVSRIQSVYASRYFRTLGVQVYVGYLFNHESPMRGPNYISQSIATTAKRIAKGEHATIKVGDISVEKEWGFAYDITEGIWTLVSQETVFEATIGTGIALPISAYLDAIFDLLGKNWRDFVSPDPNFVSHEKRLVSNPSTMLSLGWRHKTSLMELAKLMLYDSTHTMLSKQR